VVVDASSSVEQEWAEDPLDDVFLIGDFLQEELNEFVVVNQLVIRTSNLLEELLNVALQPFDLHHGNFERMQFLILKLAK
jgi:hypothetical protein